MVSVVVSMEEVAVMGKGLLVVMVTVSFLVAALLVVIKSNQKQFISSNSNFRSNTAIHNNRGRTAPKPTGPNSLTLLRFQLTALDGD